MTRVCFRLRVRPELVTEYRERHRAVPDDMLREIAASGRRDYSIFLSGDGELVGVFTVDDLAASTAYLASSPIATAWEADSAHFFLDLDGRPDQGMSVLDEVFSLDDQLTRSTDHDRLL